MRETARATTNARGTNLSMTDLSVDGLGDGQRFDPWIIHTSIFGEKRKLSEVRDNISQMFRLDGFGTLVMFALRHGASETDTCTLADNKKNVCYDLYVGDMLFRKLNGRHYKRKPKRRWAGT